jgi:hypothetical protein
VSAALSERFRVAEEKYGNPEIICFELVPAIAAVA